MAATTLDQATKLQDGLKKENIASPIFDSIVALIKRRNARLKLKAGIRSDIISST
jgi:hypothetical protein